MKRIFAGSLATLLAVVGVVIVLGGCGGAQKESATSEATTETAKAPLDAANAVVTDENGTRVTLAVTGDGFEPAMVVVPAGKPVTLVVTRQTDRTCATELVMKEHNINLALPLNQAVEAMFTPAAAETLTYACGMDMYKGKIVVQ